MFAELDRLLEPVPLAARSWRLAADTPLQGWPRLVALGRGEGEAEERRRVRVEVTFAVDEAGEPVMTGRLATTLRCICQRCLEEMELALVAEPKLFFGPVARLGAAAEAGGFEACEPEPGATLRQVLEDELLLSVPAFPAHADGKDCGPLAQKLAALEAPAGGDGSGSPFAVLAGLKRKN